MTVENTPTQEQPVSAATEVTSTASGADTSVPAAGGPSPASEVAAGVTPSAAEPAKAAEPTPEPKKDEPSTILGAPKEEPKPEAVKPEEPKKDEIPAEAEKPAEKKEEASQSEEAPLPTYEEFKVPEGITLEKEQIGKFTEMLAEFEKTKPDHAAFQSFGQKLVDTHIAEMQAMAKKVEDSYRDAWETQRKEWKESFEKDPEIGGNRQITTVNAARDFISTFGGTDAQQAEFRNLMETTGLGNHPAVIRILANAMIAKPEPKALAAVKPIPQVQSKIAKRYGSTN